MIGTSLPSSVYCRQAHPVSFHRGSFLVSRLAYFHQDRFIAFAFLTVSYMPPAGTPFDANAINAQMEQMVGYGPLGYQIFFCEDGAPEILREHVSAV